MLRAKSGIYLPHAGQKLDQSTISVRNAHDHIRLSNIARAHVDTAKNESSQGESRQAQRSSVSNFTGRRGAIETGLHFTPESRETALGGVYMGERAIVVEEGRVGVVRVHFRSKVTITEILLLAGVADFFVVGHFLSLMRQSAELSPKELYTNCRERTQEEDGANEDRQQSTRRRMTIKYCDQWLDGLVWSCRRSTYGRIGAVQL